MNNLTNFVEFDAIYNYFLQPMTNGIQLCKISVKVKMLYKLGS